MKTYRTQSTEETKSLAQRFSQDVQGGQCICLHGDLGSGKTTFTQGLLKSLGAQGPYTSPTFVIIKKYDLSMGESEHKKIHHIYHIDAYRINADAMVELGWQEMIEDSHAIVIIEWPEQVSSVLPEKAQKIDFTWINENTREIRFNT